MKFVVGRTTPDYVMSWQAEHSHVLITSSTTCTCSAYMSLHAVRDIGLIHAANMNPWAASSAGLQYCTHLW